MMAQLLLGAHPSMMPDTIFCEIVKDMDWKQVDGSIASSRCATVSQESCRVFLTQLHDAASFRMRTFEDVSSSSCMSDVLRRPRRSTILNQVIRNYAQEHNNTFVDRITTSIKEGECHHRNGIVGTYQ